MFAVVQFPLTDVRPFLDVDTHRVAPIFPIIDVPDDPYRAPFVRGFGRTRRRLLGGVDEWPAEDAYCDVTNALRLDKAILKGIGAFAERGLRTYCAFRRLYWDGQFRSGGAVVGRVEVGIGTRRQREDVAPFESGEMTTLVDALLAHPVSIYTARKRQQDDANAPRRVKLSNAGPPLASAYLHASTLKTGVGVVQDWWLQSGAPIVIVQYDPEGEVDALPARTRPVELDSATLKGGPRVFLGRRTLEGRERPIWYFEARNAGAQKDAARRLRINVTRLHSALTSFRLLSDLQLRGKLNPSAEVAKRQLHDCLNNYLPLLYQERYNGFDWTEFLRAAMTLSETLTPGQFATLRSIHPAPGRGLNAQLDRAEEAVRAHQPSAPVPFAWDIFIAHDSADKAVARSLYDLLKDGARVFFDAESVRLGDNFDTVIRDAHRASYITLVLVGQSGDRAYYFRSEVQTAIQLSRLDEERHRVIPIYLAGEMGRGAAEPYGLNLKQGIALQSLDDLPAAAARIIAALHPPQGIARAPR